MDVDEFPDSCRTIFPRYIILWPWSAHDYTFTQQCRGLRFGKGMASHASCSLCRTIALFFVILLNLKLFRRQKLEDLVKMDKFRPEKRRDAIAGQIDPSQVQFGQILTTVVQDLASPAESYVPVFKIPPLYTVLYVVSTFFL